MELPADKRVPVAAETRLFGPDALLDLWQLFAPKMVGLINDIIIDGDALLRPQL